MGMTGQGWESLFSTGSKRTPDSSEKNFELRFILACCFSRFTSGQ